MLTKRKKYFFVVLTLLVSILLTDIGAQTIYYIYRGRPTWKKATEIFNASGITYQTNDERYISLKQNHISEDNEHGYTWIISTDEYGFRIGKQKPSEISNIVFLGDSVPFGYGVNSEDSVPSILHEILLNKGIDIGIINAAIPSYSLDQSVHRYKYEIVNKFPSNVIILQIFDPASQLSLLGKKWDVSLNSATLPAWHASYNSSIYNSNICDYSAICYLLRRYFGKTKEDTIEPLNIDDEMTISNYKTSIKKSLDILNQTAVDTEIFLLLPVTVSKKSWAKASKEGKKTISVLNSVLKEYADSNEKIVFVDTIALFKNHADKKIFIDSCHLSSFGAKLQAELIAQELFNNNLSL